MNAISKWAIGGALTGVFGLVGFLPLHEKVEGRLSSTEYLSASISGAEFGRYVAIGLGDNPEDQFDVTDLKASDIFREENVGKLFTVSARSNVYKVIKNFHLFNVPDFAWKATAIEGPH